MSKIIFNADDLGLSKGVNEGIAYCYENGVVNSSTLLVNTPHFEDTVMLIENRKLKNIGLHFNLTEGKPIQQTHKSIVDNKGDFLRDIFLQSSIDLKEVLSELEAQYKKAVAAGVKIEHIDSHHHLHMTQLLMPAFLAFSQKYELPIRKIPNTFAHPIKRFRFNRKTKSANFYTQTLSMKFYGENATFENLVEILNAKRSKSLEIMCHPGYLDNENGIYNEKRVEELNILTNSEITQLIR